MSEATAYGAVRSSQVVEHACPVGGIADSIDPLGTTIESAELAAEDTPSTSLSHIRWQGALASPS